MKWKFSLWANVELKFCKKLLHIFTKVIFEAFHGEFLLKVGLIWFRDIRKNIPFFKYEGSPQATPTTQYHGIMEYMQYYENTWLGFWNHTFLHVFCVCLRTNLNRNRPNANGQILTIHNIQVTFLKFCETGLIYHLPTIILVNNEHFLLICLFRQNK